MKRHEFTCANSSYYRYCGTWSWWSYLGFRKETEIKMRIPVENKASRQVFVSGGQFEYEFIKLKDFYSIRENPGVSCTEEHKEVDSPQRR